MEVDTNDLLHRIGAVLRVISDKLDRLVELANDHFADADKMVADEPPKKWRIREAGEEVQEGDLMNTKSNPPSEPPDGDGWIDASICVGSEVAASDECVFAGPVADEPAKEVEPEHPAGPKPNPGEGHRILSKDPPEDLQEGDEFFHSTLGRWRESIHAGWGYKRQDTDCWYRRKIEAAKPAWEPKVGDWVLVTRPENWVKCSDPWWDESMNRFDRQVGQIEREWQGHFQIRGFIASKEWQYIFHRDWLSPAEPPKAPQPEYREPVLPGDAGQPCEFSMTEKDWYPSLLSGFQVHNNPWISSNLGRWNFARIKKES